MLTACDDKSAENAAAMTPEVGVVTPVSYTHLDVYKRQSQQWAELRIIWRTEQ